MNWSPKRQGMFCGISEAEEHTYKLVEGKLYMWLYAIQDNPADNIYVVTDHKEGFSGATINFKLENGTTYKAKGPWHSNADAFYEDTGIDLRRKHKTFVVISKKVRWLRTRQSFVDVIYIDDAPVIGDFNRGEDLAEAYANELKIPVYYHVESAGGSRSGFINPELH